jgi:hypothetical protein
LENYFLEEIVWEMVFKIIDTEQAWLKSVHEIRNQLHQIAKANLSLATCLLAASSLRNRVGHVSCVSKNASNKGLDEIIEGFQASATNERNRVNAALDELEIEKVVTDIHNKVQHSLSEGDKWKTGAVLIRTTRPQSP